MELYGAQARQLAKGLNSSWGCWTSATSTPRADNDDDGSDDILLWNCNISVTSVSDKHQHMPGK